jgi:hypothetical protein
VRGSAVSALVGLMSWDEATHVGASCQAEALSPLAHHKRSTRVLIGAGYKPVNTADLPSFLAWCLEVRKRCWHPLFHPSIYEVGTLDSESCTDRAVIWLACCRVYICLLFAALLGTDIYLDAQLLSQRTDVRHSWCRACF